MRRANLFWGAALVLIGVLLILGRLLSFSVWKLFGPLAIIGVGLWILWGATRERPAIEDEHVSIPLDGAERARIRMHHGAGELRIGAGRDQDALLVGTFAGGLAVRQERRDQILHLDMRTPSERVPWALMPGSWGNSKGLTWDMTLRPDTPLSLVIDAGANNTELDLSELTVTELVLKTGLSATRVVLPAHAGHTRVQVETGLASVNIQVPLNVGARIRSEGGLASVDLDRMRFPRVGAGHESTGYEDAQDRVDIDIKVGLGSVTIR